MTEHKKHQKHANLQKPKMGQWGRGEYAILGTTCGEIQAFAKELAAHMSKLNVVYIDESHKEVNEPATFYMHAIRQGDHWNHINERKANPYQNKLQFSTSDIQLINGNHFTADRQIVFLEDKKKDSLQRKIDRITNLKIIVKQHKDQEVYPFLKALMQTDTVEVIRDDVKVVSDIITSDRHKNQKILGLILAGGKSTRMGFDKGSINYHGMSQVNYLNSLLRPYCDEVFVSLRPDQQLEYDVPIIEDSFQGFGPVSGILSAFKHDPNAAWLTVASDLPFVDEESIKTLLQSRDERKIASCYIRSESEFPDPLFTIWEPKAYCTLLSYLSLGYACPRKVLINSDVNVIPIKDDRILMNVNDPEALKEAKSIIN